MAINKNHEFEELNGVKCGIVEKNVRRERAGFLKDLLTHNKYSVIITASPAAKPTGVVKPVAEGDIVDDTPIAPPLAETFTVGVTDYTFNPINAIFGRLLTTTDGHVVTQAYWRQQETISHDEIPYYEHK